MHFSIVPGAVITPSLETEQPAPLRRQRVLLPEQGGVGKLPLPVIHQGALPICTGVAAANARTILQYQQTGRIIPFSGLFIYKMNRLFDGLDKDARGSTLAASMQTLLYKGVCPEMFYPSNQRNCQKPFPANGQSLLKNAQPYRIADYQPCEYLTDILTALAQEHPVAFSMVIYTDFYQARQGVVPDKRRGRRIGGHSMVAVNYDLNREWVQVLQSWGRGKNGPTDGGYMYIPFSWFNLRDTLTEHSVLIEAFALRA